MTTSKSVATKAARSAAGQARGVEAVEACIASAPAFAQPLMEYLRSLVHEVAPDAVEEIKWSRPFFVVNGNPVCYIAAFKQHCGFGFWSPEMVAVLAQDGIAEPGASGSFGRITSMADLPAKANLLRYIRHASDLARTDVVAKPIAGGRRASAKASIAVPEEFAQALEGAKHAAATFEALPPSCRREYLEWITSAKRPETQQRRIQATIDRLAAGKRFNEEYRPK